MYRVFRIVLMAGLSGLALWQVGALVFVDNLAAAQTRGKDAKLSSLKIFNRVLLLVKENYVDPSRIEPREMLFASLTALEQAVPEIMVGDPVGDQFSVQVGSFSRQFAVGEMTSLWDLSFKLRDVSRFIEQHLSKEQDVAEVEYAAINGMLSKLDPHSRLLEPKVSKDMKTTTRGQFGGLGLVISIRNGFLTVISPLDGTPAFRVGIKAQDGIVRIGENSTINMGLDEALELLRGEPGTSVDLTILRKGESTTRPFVVVRANIKVDSVSSRLLSGQVGYVKVKAFHGNTADEVTDAIEVLRKQAGELKGLVLDFRNNPGGLLEQSVALADRFLTSGTIVVTQGAKKDNREEESATPDGNKIDLPMVVLVNGGSASASEIVAGAMKNLGRGLVIGQQTFGKGSVQMVYDFVDQSSLKLTIAEYLTPGDESIQSIGITPDIKLNAMVTSDADSLSLFSGSQLREEDLEAHLSKKNMVLKQPLFQVSYVAEKTTQDEEERKSLSSQVEEDFEMSFAKRLLAKTKSAKREDMMAAGQSLVSEVAMEQSNKLTKALAGFGINWEKAGQTVGKSDISTRLVNTPRTNAGETLKVVLEVKNNGPQPVWQLRGISESPTPLFADREFLFGKLMPGEKRSWTVRLTIPKDAISRRDLMRVKLQGNDGDDFGSLDIPVIVDGLPRPVLAHSYFLEDKGDHADGKLNVGEKVDLVVFVKNVGKGVSEEPMVLLKNLNGVDVYIDEGRQKLKPLKANEVAVARFKFTLKKNIDQAKLELQLFDAAMGDGWVDKLTFPVSKSAAKTRIAKGIVKVKKSRLALRTAADDKAQAIAYLDKDQSLLKIGESGLFTHVRINHDLSGFVSAPEVETVFGEEKKEINSKTPEIVFLRKPPQIQFLEARSPVVSKGSYKLHLAVKGDTPIHDTVIFVNDKKIYYHSFENADQPKVDFEKEIKLKPGTNVVTVLVRETDTYSHRQSLHIYSESGDPLAISQK